MAWQARCGMEHRRIAYVFIVHLVLCSLSATHSAAFNDVDTEHEYVTSQFVRLASLHSCSALQVSIVTRFPNVPEDSITILEAIAQELTRLGVQDVKFNDRAVLLATLPASYGAADAAPLALVSHVDQSGAYPLRQVGIFSMGRRGMPDALTPVKPRVYRNWNGSAIAFPDGPADLIMSTDTMPRLSSARNKTLITTSGGSPLGADGVAGAVSMLALARRWAVARRSSALEDGRRIDAALLPPAHGPIRLIFLPAGELSAAQSFLTAEDVSADVAYILDAEVPGDIRYESPMYVHYELKLQAYRLQPALGSGVSHDYPSVYRVSLCHLPFIASQIVALVAESRFSCATSIDREPFIEVKKMDFGEDAGGMSIGSVRFLARAFDHGDVAKVTSLLENATSSVRQRHAKCANITLFSHAPVDLNSWHLMGEDAGPVRLARAAMRAAGLVPVSTAVRSSTDAVFLSKLGMPTLLLYSAWHAAHGPLEWTTTEEMMQVTDVVQGLATLFLRQHAKLKWCPLGGEYDPEGNAMNGPAS